MHCITWLQWAVWLKFRPNISAPHRIARGVRNTTPVWFYSVNQRHPEEGFISGDSSPPPETNSFKCTATDWVGIGVRERDATRFPSGLCMIKRPLWKPFICLHTRTHSIAFTHPAHPSIPHAALLTCSTVIGIWFDSFHRFDSFDSFDSTLRTAYMHFDILILDYFIIHVHSVTGGWTVKNIQSGWLCSKMWHRKKNP